VEKQSRNTESSVVLDWRGSEPMSKAILNKIWSFITPILLYFTLNVWSLTQQWQLSFPGNPFKADQVTPHGATIYGIPVCSAFLIVVCIVTMIYSRRARGLRWYRIPRFVDFDLDFSDKIAKVFQLVMLALLLVLPAVGICHFQLTMMDGRACEVSKDGRPLMFPGTQKWECVSGWHGLLLEERPFPRGEAIRYDPSADGKFGMSYSQPLVAWLCLFSSTLAIASVLLTLATFVTPERRE
jgi:hypothetical protein